jgi:hypothetical protein
MAAEWVTPVLSVAGALLGSVIGVKVGLARQEEKLAALRDRVTEHAGAVNERLKVLGERTHKHADRITENSLQIHNLVERVERMERRSGEER